MKLIVCLDTRNGWIFNKRRLSKDGKVTERILEISKEKILNLSKYSYQLFNSPNYDLSKNDFNIITFPIHYYTQNELYFIEEYPDIEVNFFDEIIIFRWDKTYPYDVRFPIDIVRSNLWNLKTSNTFSGTSHGIIIEEHWERVV